MTKLLLAYVAAHIVGAVIVGLIARKIAQQEARLAELRATNADLELELKWDTR